MAGPTYNDYYSYGNSEDKIRCNVRQDSGKPDFSKNCHETQNRVIDGSLKTFQWR